MALLELAKVSKSYPAATGGAELPILAGITLKVERGESVGVAQASYYGATLRENLPAALELFADLIRRPHLPADRKGTRRTSQ